VHLSISDEFQRTSVLTYGALQMQTTYLLT